MQKYRALTDNTDDQLAGAVEALRFGLLAPRHGARRSHQ